MAKVFHCSDLGVSCNWYGSAETEEQLLKKIAEHTAEVHNIKDMNEEMLAKIRSSIQDK
jgi:predicted small metal-binding protein